MAQGFKAKVAPGKQRSTASVNKQAGKMKKGARIVPPKKKELVEAAAKKRASSSAHGQQFENNVAAKAATKGKLTVMKEQAGKGDAQAKR